MRVSKTSEAKLPGYKLNFFENSPQLIYISHRQTAAGTIITTCDKLQVISISTVSFPNFNCSV